jgi:heptosyltransferase I
MTIADLTTHKPLRPDRQRVLIIKPSALGDVATTLPLLCDLKRAYPEADIDWLVHPGLTALLEGHDALHEIIPFDRKKLASWWWRPSAFRAFWQLLKRLRRRRYDLVIDAQGLFRSGFLAWVTGAQIRIGFADAREFASRFYTKTVALPDHGRKMIAVDRMRVLLQPLDIRPRGPAEFRMPIRRELNSPYRLEHDYVVVIPGARWNTKRWPAERYGELAKHLLSCGEHIVLLGSPDERRLCEQIARDAGSSEHVEMLAGKTTLAEMIAILARAKLVIGNDSGPLHVAVALGRKIVGIYGPTDPAFVGPYQQLDMVVRHDVACFPCRNRECSHHSCMNGVPVELVWEKTRQSLPVEK